MTRFFPKHTDQWHFEEPTLFRRFTFSILEMAVLTGITLRLFRALANSHSSTSWIWLGGTIALSVLIVCAMATLHLANYPVRRWVVRAPLFALAEAATESVTSLVLIWLGREPSGSARAGWSDWLPMAASTLSVRMIEVCGWALFLAGVVWVVRRTILRERPVEEEPIEDAAQA